MMVDRGYEMVAQKRDGEYKIDLAVIHPDDRNRYVLGIECDGASYHSDPDVRDRDMLRQKRLLSRGWEIERVWSKDWWNDRDKVAGSIEARIGRILERERRGAGRTPASSDGGARGEA